MQDKIQEQKLTLADLKQKTAGTLKEKGFIIAENKNQLILITFLRMEITMTLV